MRKSPIHKDITIYFYRTKYSFFKAHIDPPIVLINSIGLGDLYEPFLTCCHSFNYGFDRLLQASYQLHWLRSAHASASVERSFVR